MTVGDLDTFRSEFAAWVENTHAVGGVGVRTQSPAHNMGAMCYTFFGCHEESQAELARAISIARAAQSPLLEQACNAFGAMSYLIRGDLRAGARSRGSRAAGIGGSQRVDHGDRVGMVVASHLGDDAMIDKWFGAFEAAADRGSTNRLRRWSCRNHGAARTPARCGRTAAPCASPVRTDSRQRADVASSRRYGDAEDREYARSHLARAAGGPADSLERAALLLFDAYSLQRERQAEEAKALAMDSASRFRRLRAPLLEAAALEAAGEREAALRLYRRCGAAYETAPATRGAACGGRGTHGGVERCRGDALRPRARDRLMAAAGQSNLEIARVSSISLVRRSRNISLRPSAKLASRRGESSGSI